MVLRDRGGAEPGSGLRGCGGTKETTGGQIKTGRGCGGGGGGGVSAAGRHRCRRTTPTGGHHRTHERRHSQGTRSHPHHGGLTAATQMEDPYCSCKHHS